MAFAATLLALCGHAGATEPQSVDYSGEIPAAVRGPFVSDPAVLRELDCPTPQCNGPLNFARLMQARIPPKSRQRMTGNPFTLPIAAKILSLVESDLNDLRVIAGATEGQLSPKFLTDAGSRVELVGAINRMDRQFIRDPSAGLTPRQLDCGEVSLLYRFSYSIRDGKQQSRLPVTLNLVFPALPSHGRVTCQEIARRWVGEMESQAVRSPKRHAADLRNGDRGALAFITGRELLRVELNMQAYRKSASTDETNFGTEAAYLIRVFKWDEKAGLFLPEFLRDQIDRDKVLCSAADSASDCAAKKARRKALVAFLSKPDVIASIDKGTLEVDYGLGVLAVRAASTSPGGFHRSKNQPYWNAGGSDQDVITDAEIAHALEIAKTKRIPLSFIKSIDDFRTRLNETSCTGCHQTRAIAGFHFPGADRQETPAVNAVLVAGSPHFYGDQPRRADIVRLIAHGRHRLNEYELATSYSARPMARFAERLASTQMIGGWGATCLMPEAIATSRRDWPCRSDLQLACVPLFRSHNDPGVGTCVPDQRHEIGDPLQRGDVITTGFGKDTYVRTAPQGPDTRIPDSALPANPPPMNGYYGSHQEFFAGDASSTDRATRRDALTGGFPSGMLRLSECLGLPSESTCALIATSGFNTCIGRLASDPTYTINTCFENFTSFAGMRACDAGSPCRDDYICVRPMGFTPATADQLYEERRQRLMTNGYFKAINNRDYDPDDFGQQRPDAAWVQRNDQRGVCIPPYFVFQFRSDGHPAPPQMATTPVAP
ncbi:MAG TPA: hypothetical protein VFN10_13775 [Thermoanaerobaculia bacterium]|nr:hypothetical protein [Thermoanaerobaculia bacterium]